VRARPRVKLVAAMVSVIAMTAGCAIFSPRPDTTKFYVLTPVTPPDSTTSASSATSRLAIGLGPIKFPAYLEHPEVITRVASNRLDLASNDRWAEPLDESFRRVLAANLGVLLGTDQVMPFPWDLSTPTDYKIEVNVARFERDGSGGTQLLGDWVIRDGRSNRILMSQQANFAESDGSGVESAAAALSADLSDLSKQLADAVIELNQQRLTRAAN
jgi:uncharacterized lipoprotein YmbA